jgi:VWFA-related protein
MADQAAPLPRSLFAAVAFLLSITAVVSTQDPPASQGPAQPTFRAGVNVVRVDVIVTDDEGNPVTDLRKEEFEIVEDGRAQTIDLFRQIRIDGSVSDAARPRQVLNRDTEDREASRDDVRIFAILLSDYQVCAERSRLVRDALASFIRKLGPNDLVAVMNPLMSVRDMAFTYDHESILRAIQGFEGRRGDYTPRNPIEEEHAKIGAVERLRAAVVRDALKAVAVRLGSMREGRKSLIFVSEGFPAGWFSDPRQLREISQEANRQNTSIYPIDPRGLVSGGGDVAPTIRPGCGRVPSSMAMRLTQDTLRELADETDGRAIVNRNSLTEGLGQILRDSSLYYLLGYSSTASQTDGKFHRIRVRVTRPKVDVRARKGYWASTAEDVSRAANPVPVTPQPILDALAEIAAPSQEGRLVRTWVGIGRGAEGKGRVTVAWEPLTGVGAARAEGAASVMVTATRPRGGTVFESPAVNVEAGTAQDISFDVSAGALEVKITVADREGHTIDRETHPLDVPDYAGGVATLGTPQFHRARTAREFQALAADANAVPMAARDFARTERLLIRFDAFAAGGEAASPAAAILSRAGRRMFDVPVTVATAGASHQIDLALSPLPVGEYVLEVVGAPNGPRQLSAFRIR